MTVVSYYDLDAALTALEGLGYEPNRTEKHLHDGPGGTIAEMIPCLGGEVEVRFSTPVPPEGTLRS